MATTLNIDDHKADPYLIDYMQTRAQGRVHPVEFANTALSHADFKRMVIATHGDDLDKAQAEAVCERVALAASATAKALAQGRDELAAAFANHANSEALVLDSFDYVNVG